MILLYNIANIILFPIYCLILLFRIINKKDSLKSVAQRLSITDEKKPTGRLVWIHAASVGESKVAVTLIKGISTIYPDINFLITTGTLSSAKILKSSLPKNVIHQFMPIDNIFVVRKFLSHWKPVLGIFVESEFWPCLVTEAAKKFNIIIVNARLSDKSYNIWQYKKNLFGLITSNFKLVAVQSSNDLQKYQNLGCSEAVNLGNIKFANKRLTYDETGFSNLKKLLGNKAVFLATSTHLEDEKILLQIVKEFKEKNIDYYPIIIPRHPERRNELIKECYNLGLSFKLRSQDKNPSLNDDLYIVDSFGEIGLFYNLSDVVFIGGSFKRGGHNLVEPAYFNNVIILGPDMSNFRDITKDMLESDAAIQVKDKSELAEKILFFLDKNNRENNDKFIKNANNFVSDKEKVIDNYLEVIKNFL
jgi:3-deoxy-D-manno-octulosonic-acid transferase